MQPSQPPHAHRDAAARPASATPIDVVSRSLRQAYDEALQESIPDAFMDLLRKLD